MEYKNLIKTLKEQLNFYAIASETYRVKPNKWTKMDLELAESMLQAIEITALTSEWGLGTCLIHIILDEMKKSVIRRGFKPKLNFKLLYKEKILLINNGFYDIGVSYSWLANVYIREVIYKTMIGELPLGDIDYKIKTIINKPEFNILSFSVEERGLMDNFIDKSFVLYHTAVKELQKLYADNLKAITSIPKDFVKLILDYDGLMKDVLLNLPKNRTKSYKYLLKQVKELREYIEDLSLKLNFLNN